MAFEIRIPKLGLTMKEAVLSEWTAAAGSFVEKDQIIALAETDKVNFEIAAPGEGLLHPVVKQGTRVAVAAVIAYIAADKKELQRLQDEFAAGVEKFDGEEFAPEKVNPDSGSSAAGGGSAVRIKATPVARAIAKKHNIDLGAIQGSGPHGRIVKQDVISVLERQAESAPAPDSAEEPGLLSVSESIPIKGIRRIIFDNMHLSLNVQAQLTIHTDASATGMQDLRRSQNHELANESYSVSYNAVLVKAIATALCKHPHINASVDGDFIRIWQQIHIGIAMDFGRGLIVPKIRNVDTKSLEQIARELEELSMKARDNALLPDDFQAGTFTLTNLGAWDVDDFTPIVNSPESAILGVGRIVEKPWARDGQVVVEPRVALSLTFDHRIIDGAPAAAFLKTVKDMLEDPLRML